MALGLPELASRESGTSLYLTVCLDANSSLTARHLHDNAFKLSQKSYSQLRFSLQFRGDHSVPEATCRARSLGKVAKPPSRGSHFLNAQVLELEQLVELV